MAKQNGVIFNKDKKQEENGAQFPQPSDIETLISVVKEIEVNTQHNKKSIPRTPEYGDFTSHVGDLDTIVPMGFLMLHNDFSETLSSLEKFFTNVSKFYDTNKKSTLYTTDYNENINEIVSILEAIYLNSKNINVNSNNDFMDLNDSSILEKPNLPVDRDSLFDNTKTEPKDTSDKNTFLQKFISNTETNNKSNKKNKRNKIPKNPKYEDFTKNIGNLDLVVPMGYVMLHNDFEDVITYLENIYQETKKTAESGSSGGDLSSAISGVKDLAGIVAGSAILAGLLKDMTLGDVVDKVIVLGDWLVDNLGNVLKTVVDLASYAGQNILTLIANVGDMFDDDIKAERKKYLKFYLSAYYQNLMASLGYEAVLNEDGDITGIKAKEKKAYDTGNEDLDVAYNVADFTVYTLGEIGDEAIEFAGNAITSLSTAISSSISTFADKGVKEVATKWLSLYVSAYYQNMMASLGYEAVFDDSGEIVGLKEKEIEASDTGNEALDVAYDVLGVVDETINDAGDTVINLASEAITGLSTAIKSAITTFFGDGTDEAFNKYYSYYLMAYFGRMIAGLGFTVDYEKEIVTANDIIKTVALTSGNWTGIDDFTSALRKINTSVTKVSDLASMGEHTQDAYGLYLKAIFYRYIMNMGFVPDYEAMTISEREDTTLNIPVKAFSSIDDFASAISKINASFTTYESLAQVGQFAQDAYGMYLKAYYANLILSMGYKVDYQNNDLIPLVDDDELTETVTATKKSFLGKVSGAIASISTSWNTEFEENEAKSTLRDAVVDSMKEIIGKLVVEGLNYDTAISYAQKTLDGIYKGLYKALVDEKDGVTDIYNFYDNLTAQKLIGDAVNSLADIPQYISLTSDIQNSVNSVFTESKVNELLYHVGDILWNLNSILTKINSDLIPNTKAIKDSTKVIEGNTIPITKSINNVDSSEIITL